MADTPLSRSMRWPDDVREALEGVIQSIAESGPHDSRAGARSAEVARADSAPVAVFDFDNTCISNDIGEAFHLWMATHHRYRLRPGGALDVIDERDGLAEIVELAEARRRRGETDADPRLDRRLRDLVFATYARHMAHAGKGPTYQWQLGLLAGLTVGEVEACAEQCIADALEEPHEDEVIEVDGVPSIHVRHGFDVRPEIVELMRALESAGAEVWVCSASMWWLVAPFAEAHFGVPRDRVLAARTVVGTDGLMTTEAALPPAFSEGKVALIDAAVGRPPRFAAGDSMTDFEMLAHTDGDVLVFDRDHELTRRALKRGWIVCPVLEGLG